MLPQLIAEEEEFCVCAGVRLIGRTESQQRIVCIFTEQRSRFKIMMQNFVILS
jgi:hypothetical protein